VLVSRMARAEPATPKLAPETDERAP
jgi:hypothetical protein